MRNTLYLTPDEQPLFAALSDALKEGWSVETVSTLHEETQDEIAFRLRMAKVQDHALRSVIENVSKASDIVSAAKAIDYGDLPPAAFGELCFLIGVKALTAMIRSALSNAEKDEDLDGIVGLSYIRKSLSEVNAPVS